MFITFNEGGSGCEGEAVGDGRRDGARVGWKWVGGRDRGVERKETFDLVWRISGVDKVVRVMPYRYI